MSDKFRERIIHSLLYGRSFLLSILIGILCGLVCGLAGCAFLAVTGPGLRKKRPLALDYLFPPPGRSADCLSLSPCRGL